MHSATAGEDSRNSSSRLAVASTWCASEWPSSPPRNSSSPFASASRDPNSLSVVCVRVLVIVSAIRQPSRADEALTQTLKAALALVDIRFLDHVITSDEGALSDQALLPLHVETCGGTHGLAGNQTTE
jgi:hypothetical protein